MRIYAPRQWIKKRLDYETRRYPIGSRNEKDISSSYRILILLDAWDSTRSGFRYKSTCSILQKSYRETLETCQKNPQICEGNDYSETSPRKKVRRLWVSGLFVGYFDASCMDDQQDRHSEYIFCVGSSRIFYYLTCLPASSSVCWIYTLGRKSDSRQKNRRMYSACADINWV